VGRARSPRSARGRRLRRLSALRRRFLQALTDDALDAPLPDARVSDAPLVEALFRCRERRRTSPHDRTRPRSARPLGLPVASRYGRGVRRRAGGDRVRSAASRTRARRLLTPSSPATRNVRAKPRHGGPRSAPESRTASRTATNDSAIEGSMWTTLGARQGASFARLRDLLRRTSPSAILDGDQADAELIDAWLLHVGLGLPNP
jgi:hypothetical protein